jgi:hypothetical protein
MRGPTLHSARSCIESYFLHYSDDASHPDSKNEHFLQVPFLLMEFKNLRSVPQVVHRSNWCGEGFFILFVDTGRERLRTPWLKRHFNVDCKVHEAASALL